MRSILTKVGAGFIGADRGAERPDAGYSVGAFGPRIELEAKAADG